MARSGWATLTVTGQKTLHSDWWLKKKHGGKHSTQHTLRSGCGVWNYTCIGGTTVWFVLCISSKHCAFEFYLCSICSSLLMRAYFHWLHLNERVYMHWSLRVIYRFKKFSGYGYYMFTAKSGNTCSQDLRKFPGFDFCLNNVEVFKLCDHRGFYWSNLPIWYNEIRICVSVFSITNRNCELILSAHLQSINPSSVSTTRFYQKDRIWQMSPFFLYGFVAWSVFPSWTHRSKRDVGKHLVTVLHKSALQCFFLFTIVITTFSSFVFNMKNLSNLVI